MVIISRVTGWMVACAVLASANVAFGQSMRQVTIANSSPGIGAAAGRIAKDMGLFARHNIDPAFTVMENSSAAIAALISGSVNLAVAGTPELIVASDRGQQLVALATTYNGFSGSVVLAKSVADKLGVSPTAPVAARIKALDGLVIASPGPTTIGQVIMNNAARAVGANLRATYMAQPAMPAALETGAIQGFQASAPAWVLPVVKGTGVLWISGPKGEFPEQFAPPISAQLQTTRSYAEANPALMKDLALVFADLAKAVEERPADVKASLAKLFPELDKATIDIVFDVESLGWTGKQATPEIMAHSIELVKSSGAAMQNAAALDPKKMLYP